jgi:DNA-binding transcriptional ArsR family regulator
MLDRRKSTAILNHMVKYSAQLDSTFGALADPTRRAILATLMLGQASITELAKPHRMSLPAVMKHVRVLEGAGLVSQEKTGRTRICQLAARPLKEAEAWISQYRVFWEKTFDSLERYLAQQQTQQEKKEDQQWPRRSHNRKPRSN